MSENKINDEKIKAARHSERIMGFLTQNKFDWYGLKKERWGYEADVLITEITAKTNTGKSFIKDQKMAKLQIYDDGYIVLVGHSLSMYVEPGSDSKKVNMVILSFIISFMDIRMKEQKLLEGKKK